MKTEGVVQLEADETTETKNIVTVRFCAYWRCKRPTTGKNILCDACLGKISGKIDSDGRGLKMLASEPKKTVTFHGEIKRKGLPE